MQILLRFHLFILWQHPPVQLAWVRHNVVFSCKFADFEAIVAKLGEPIPEVLLVLQQEDRELAGGGATVWVWVLHSEPANDLALHYKCRLQPCVLLIAYYGCNIHAGFDFSTGSRLLGPSPSGMPSTNAICM